MWKDSPMSELMFTPSADEKVMDSSAVRPSLGEAVQTTFCTLIGNSTICSVSGLKKTQPVTTGMSCTPRALPASLTRMPTWPASMRVTVADVITKNAMIATTAMMPRRMSRTKPPSSNETLVGGATVVSLQSVLLAAQGAHEHEHGEQDRDREERGRGRHHRIARGVEPGIQQWAQEDVRGEPTDDRPHGAMRTAAQELAPEARVL